MLPASPEPTLFCLPINGVRGYLRQPAIMTRTWGCPSSKLFGSLLLLGVLVRSDSLDDYARLDPYAKIVSPPPPLFGHNDIDQDRRMIESGLLAGFADLSQVPHLKPSGVYDIIIEEDYRQKVDSVLVKASTPETSSTNAGAFGKPSAPEPIEKARAFEKPTAASIREQQKQRLIISAHTSESKSQFWNAWKRNLPYLDLRTSRLYDLIHTNRRHDSNGNAASPPLPKQDPLQLAKNTCDMLVRLLPWTIMNAKLLQRMAPALGGYVFGKVPRLLLPLYIAQRSYRFLYLVGQDWYTGRYVRIQFERMQRQYHTRYRIPDCLRSIGRFLSHLLCLSVIGYVVKRIINVTSGPCKASQGGCNVGCGVVWLVAVLGAGHAIGVAIAIWSPLRIRVDDLQRPSIQNIQKPMRLLRWILDPDKWFRDIIERDRFVPTQTLKPFNPDAVLFPATWSLLRVLQMIAVVQHMRGPRMVSMMRQIVLQQALNDEWYRVLMCEKRVAWAMVFMVLVRPCICTPCLRLTSLFQLLGSALGILLEITHSESVGNISLFLAFPSVLAAIISSWMNILVYFDRRQALRSPYSSTWSS
jgi:hypothetical protein